MIKIPKFPWHLWIYHVFLNLKSDKMYHWYISNIASCVSWYVPYRIKYTIQSPRSTYIISTNNIIFYLMLSTNGSYLALRTISMGGGGPGRQQCNNARVLCRFYSVHTWGARQILVSPKQNLYINIWSHFQCITPLLW